MFLIESRYFNLDCNILSLVLKLLVNIAAFFSLKCFFRVVTNGTCLFLFCGKLCYVIILFSYCVKKRNLCLLPVIVCIARVSLYLTNCKWLLNDPGFDLSISSRIPVLQNNICRVEEIKQEKTCLL